MDQNRKGQIKYMKNTKRNHLLEHHLVLDIPSLVPSLLRQLNGLLCMHTNHWSWWWSVEELGKMLASFQDDLKPLCPQIPTIPTHHLPLPTIQISIVFIHRLITPLTLPTNIPNHLEETLKLLAK